VRDHATLAEVIEPRAAGWRSLDAMQRKAARDAANGNGFSRGRKVLTGEATTVPTIRRGYQKGGACDVRLAHPSRPGMARLFTAREHARIKGIPPALVAGLSEKKAHEVLGQSVISPAFVGLGRLIAQAVAA
jgi:DNA (cytosine-5)-methyltransferase 1